MPQDPSDDSSQCWLWQCLGAIRQQATTLGWRALKTPTSETPDFGGHVTSLTLQYLWPRPLGFDWKGLAASRGTAGGHSGPPPINQPGIDSRNDLNQHWASFMMPYGITRPQWVKTVKVCFRKKLLQFESCGPQAQSMGHRTQIIGVPNLFPVFLVSDESKLRTFQTRAALNA